MESIVDALSSAYNDFVAAAAAVLEAKEQAGGRKSPATDAALEAFRQRWELFRVSCDQAEEFVESMKQRIGSECLVDEATGANPRCAQGSSGIPPISAALPLVGRTTTLRWRSTRGSLRMRLSKVTMRNVDLVIVGTQSPRMDINKLMGSLIPGASVVPANSSDGKKRKSTVESSRSRKRTQEDLFEPPWADSPSEIEERVLGLEFRCRRPQVVEVAAEGHDDVVVVSSSSQPTSQAPVVLAPQSTSRGIKAKPTKAASQGEPGLEVLKSERMVRTLP
ncbi:hypothetical protein J5N97_024719 [Dioscorea zingiberensis]|uniref:Mediator of RNA polymerase II transcription subunit 32 n=1 Tax=Dioscorea zingiberensis TaxID=325984 RepID=A0A9D5H957_9LILI|nr:hypothetical protein J5N97_024719 [Dioscorea zingiberensis]